MKLCHVTIQTANFAEEIDFYTKYARLAIQRDMRPMGRNMVFLANKNGDTEIELIERPDAADLDALRADLVEAGLEPTDYVSPMPQVRFFFVKDPAGLNVQFM